MSVKVIDFAEQALGRICLQYSDKPKYIELVSALANAVQEDIDDPLGYLLTLYDIDSASGSNLDTIGEIVGQDRNLVSYADLVFFGFDGATASDTFGDINNSGAGSRMVSTGEDVTTYATGSTELADPEYRTFIRARILRNYSASIPEDFTDAIKIIFDTEQVYYTESDMNIFISILGTIDANTLALIDDEDILPRPTGVDIGTVTSYNLLKYNGATTNVIVPTSADFNIGSSDFKITASVKLLEPNQTILSKEDQINSSTASYTIYTKNGTVHFGYSAVDGTLISIDSGLYASDDTVRCVSVEKVSTSLTIKVDGEESVNSMPSDPIAGTADFLNIGSSSFFKIRDYPEEVVVSGAGTSVYNDTYAYQSEGLYIKYTGLDYDKRMYSVNGTEWYIDLIPVGTDYIVGYYAVGTEEFVPPKTGWVVVDATAPAPSASYDDLDYKTSGIIFNTSVSIGGSKKGEWLLTEGSGTTATDTSGNGNDGTITDGEWVGSLS